MKPITADNAEGRSLLALRAGPMTPSEVSGRIGQSVPGWLIKAGYVAQDDSYFRITDAGRAACPYRNPLAAPGGVQPATYKPEISMPKGEVKTTQRETLALIKAAGAEGITRKKLVEGIDASEQSVDNHIWALNRDGAIFKPKLGLLVAIEFKPAPGVSPELARLATPPAAELSEQAEAEIAAFVAGLEPEPAAPVCHQDSPKNETQTTSTVSNEAQAPALGEKFSHVIEDPEDFEVGIFSDGTMTMVMDDGLADGRVDFSPSAVKKLRAFLGLFCPEAA